MFRFVDIYAHLALRKMRKAKKWKTFRSSHLMKKMLMKLSNFPSEEMRNDFSVNEELLILIQTKNTNRFRNINIFIVFLDFRDRHLTLEVGIISFLG